MKPSPRPLKNAKVYDLRNRVTCAECGALIAINEKRVKMNGKLEIGPASTVHAECADSFRERCARRDKLVASALTDLINFIGDEL